MRLILSFLRVLIALLILATALPAVLAIFGSLVPELDIFNHLQLLLFFGTLLSAIAALLFRLSDRWKIVAVLGFAASAWTFAPEWLSSLSPRQEISDVTTIRVMTHNVFGLNYDMERVASVIAAEDPDIVALQEFFPEQHRLGGLLKETYPYSVVCRGGKRANLGLYSKLPFDKLMGPDDCPANAQGDQRTAHIMAGFTLSDGTTFSLMTTHMDWPLPAERQLDELNAAADTVRNIDGPLVVVGDFNSTPWSYALKRFEAKTGLRRETRNLITYPLLFTVPLRFFPDGLMPLTPFLPLDHVFQRGVTVQELHSGADTGSDHLPVIFTFSVNRS